MDSNVGIDLTLTCIHNEQSAAWAILKQQYAALQVSMSIGLVHHLYRTCVSSVASYGCEVWDLHRLSTQPDKMRRMITQTEAKMLKNIAGLRRTVPDLVFYQEAGLLPLDCVWLQRGLTFYIACRQAEPGSLIHQVFVDNFRAAITRRTQN